MLQAVTDQDGAHAMSSTPFDSDQGARETDRLSERQAASLATKREHHDLLVAVHRLEAALASPAPLREPQWRMRAARDLADVQHCLETHMHSVEGTEGLFAELELVSPRFAESVAKLRQEHPQMLEAARRLKHGLTSDQGLCGYESLRREAAEFLTQLRRHHAQEVDLIYEAFWTDIGVGD